MGEARRRRASDPNFGTVPKAAATSASGAARAYRGLVMSPPMEIEGTTLKTRGSVLDPQELRFALLFWEKLVWPSSRALYMPGGQDEAFLVAGGILARPEYTFNGDMAQGMAKTQLQAFSDLNRQEPGVWALAQGENSLLLRDNFGIAGSGAFLELHRAIPIPTEDVPLHDILEFRERRRDELLLLRGQIDSFVSDIGAADDPENKVLERVAEIDAACAALIAVGREWRLPFYFSNIKATVSLGARTLVPALGAGWAVGKVFGLPAAAAAAGITGLATAIEFKADIGLQSIKHPTSPYRYAYRVNKELR